MKLARLGHAEEFKVVDCRGKAFGAVLPCLHPSIFSVTWKYTVILAVLGMAVV